MKRLQEGISREVCKNRSDKVKDDFIEKHGSCCAICGDTLRHRFEFDHIDPLTKGPRIQSFFKCPTQLQKEFDKNIYRILCALCHLIVTNLYHRPEKKKEEEKISDTTRRQRENQKYINTYKLKIGKCQCCGMKVHPLIVAFFEFDHIDPRTKKFEIGKSGARARKTVIIELEKCQLLCRTCHKIRTAIEKRKEWYIYGDHLLHLDFSLTCKKFNLSDDKLKKILMEKTRKSIIWGKIYGDKLQDAIKQYCNEPRKWLKEQIKYPNQTYIEEIVAKIIASNPIERRPKSTKGQKRKRDEIEIRNHDSPESVEKIYSMIPELHKIQLKILK
jgi:hypothetical protein